MSVEKVIFSREFPSTLNAMGAVITDALDQLIQHGWLKEGDQYGFARLCLEEALVNAITHGNKCDPGRKVTLEIKEDGEVCHICVRDEGKGFQPDRVKMSECTSMRGRGIGLIRHCMDTVQFNASEHCLEMTMRRKRSC